MPQIKVTLGIGYPTATHEDVLEVDDDEWNECETEEEREKLIDSYWSEWAWNYIDGGATIIE